MPKSRTNRKLISPDAFRAKHVFRLVKPGNAHRRLHVHRYLAALETSGLPTIDSRHTSSLILEVIIHPIILCTAAEPSFIPQQLAVFTVTARRAGRAVETIPTSAIVPIAARITDGSEAVA